MSENFARLLATLTLLASGCSSNSKSVEVEEAMHNLDPTKNSDTVLATSDGTAIAAITLPYEDRTNPFSESVESAEPAPDPSTRAVLRGYIDVGGLAAVIAYRGETFVLREGESKGRITVVKIEPPLVSLRIGGIPHEVSLHHVHSASALP